MVKPTPGVLDGNVTRRLSRAASSGFLVDVDSWHDHLKDVVAVTHVAATSTVIPLSPPEPTDPKLTSTSTYGGADPTAASHLPEGDAANEFSPKGVVVSVLLSSQSLLSLVVSASE